MSTTESVVIFIFLSIFFFFIPLFWLARFTTKRRQKIFDNLAETINTTGVFEVYQVDSGTYMNLYRDSLEVSFENNSFKIPYKSIESANFYADKHSSGLRFKVNPSFTQELAALSQAPDKPDLGGSILRALYQPAGMKRGQVNMSDNSNTIDVSVPFKFNLSHYESVDKFINQHTTASQTAPIQPE